MRGLQEMLDTMRFPEWSISKSEPSEGVNCFWIMNGAMLIGEVHGPQSDPRQEMRANLIAAAPDLYKALAAIVDSVSSGPSGSVCQTDDFEDAKAALAKARGECSK